MGAQFLEDSYQEVEVVVIASCATALLPMLFQISTCVRHGSAGLSHAADIVSLRCSFDDAHYTGWK